MSNEEPVQRPLEHHVGRVKINVGTLVSQEHGIGRWPATMAREDVDADMVFDAEWMGRYWDCRADGYGRRSWLGETGGYGNGSIFVHAANGVTMLDVPPNADVTGGQRPSGGQTC